VRGTKAERGRGVAPTGNAKMNGLREQSPPDGIANAENTIQHMINPPEPDIQTA
jgi:hypothetical protein